MKNLKLALVSRRLFQVAIKFAFKFLAVLVVSAISASAHAVDLAQVEKDLKGAGAVGWIHGAVESQQIFVLTIRNPDNFFDYVELSLTTESVDIQKQLSSFHRHDQVRVKGSFLDISAPQKHIDVTAIELVKRYDSPEPVTDPYPHQAQVPDDLLKLPNSTGTFLVHAVAADGHILVTEFRDVIVPFYVKNADRTRSLYRGDLVRIHFKIQRRPHEPVHLNIDETPDSAHPERAPLEVLESIRDVHGRNLTLEGRLILFPQSPEIRFNVFAVEQGLSDGLKRQFTLVNFTDPALFQKIRETLQAAWNRHPHAFVNGRNKLISTAVHVRVSGVGNEVDSSQANPQVLISDLNALTVIE